MVQKKRYWIFGCLLGSFILGGCTSGIPEGLRLTPIEGNQPPATFTPIVEDPANSEQPEIGISANLSLTPTEEALFTATFTPVVEKTPQSDQPEIVDASASGKPGAYNFSVTISSPDEGCDQYADWWEIISQEGELIYRRILLHSHVNEQPFTRSGGPVPIEPDTIVLVRVHMHPGGYASLAMKGSLEQGFEQVELSVDFAIELGETPPLPGGCNF